MACLHIRVLGSVVHSSKNPQAHQAHLCISGSVSLPLPPSTCSFFLQKVFVTLLICHKSMRFCAGISLCVCVHLTEAKLCIRMWKEAAEYQGNVAWMHKHTHKHTDTWSVCHEILRRESFCVCADAVMRMTSCVCLCGACTVCSLSAHMISSHASLLNWKPFNWL